MKLLMSSQIVLLLLCGSGRIVLSKSVKETLVFEEGKVCPDGFSQPGIHINGQSPPGPPIILEKGDSLELLVVNKLSSYFSLHMHGLFQKGTQRSDGVPFITQDPIPPNSSYLYKTHAANQTGTYVYHAHTGLDLVYAYGVLIIKDGDEVAKNPDYYYDDEIVLICSQYWHVPIQSIVDGVTGAPFQDVPDTASILINGRSRGISVVSEDGSSEENDSSSEEDNSCQSGYRVIPVEAGKKYRIRVVGFGADTMMRMSIDGHKELNVIEVDGCLTDPVTTDHLDCNSAQRYSAIVEMNQPVDNYWIKCESLPGPGPRNGRAILHYAGASNPNRLKNKRFPGQTEELELDRWILDDLHPSTSIIDESYSVPEKVDREIIIRSFQRNFPDGSKKFDVNERIVRSNDEGPTLINLPHEDLLANKDYYGLYQIRLGERVQIVFQNTMSDDGECEQHPWHLHGHIFSVVASGPDSYDPKVVNIDEIVANRSHSIFRDVVTLYPDQVVENTTSRAPCGWTAIRFIADNPGLWLAHCHLTAHQIMGKHFVLYEY